MHVTRELFGVDIGGATKEHPQGAVTEERPREVPQRVRALRVAPLFGPRGVTKLVRSTAATTCAWLLAIFQKIGSNVAYVSSSTVS